MYTDQTLWKYVDGELRPEEADPLAKAAAADASLAARIEEFRAIKRAVLLGAPQPTPGFAARVAALAGRAPAGIPSLSLAEARRILRPALVAAAVLAAVGLTAMAVRFLPDLLRPTPIQAQDPLLGR